MLALVDESVVIVADVAEKFVSAALEIVTVWPVPIEMAFTPPVWMSSAPEVSELIDTPPTTALSVLAIVQVSIRRFNNRRNKYV
jgi:hypothetical protein